MDQRESGQPARPSRRSREPARAGVSADGTRYTPRDGSRSYLVRTADGRLSAGYRRAHRDNATLFPLPEGFQVRGTSRRVMTTDADVIAVRRLKADDARRLGFTSRKAMVDFVRQRQLHRFSAIPAARVEERVERNYRLISHEHHPKQQWLRRRSYALDGFKPDFTEAEIMATFRALVKQAITSEKLEQSDKIQLTIINRDQKPGHEVYNTNLFTVSRADDLVKHFFDKVIGFLQSSDSLRTTDSQVHVQIFKTPHGRGGHRSKSCTTKQKIKHREGVFKLEVDTFCGPIALAMTQPFAKRLLLDKNAYKASKSRNALRSKAGKALIKMLEPECRDFDQWSTMTWEKMEVISRVARVGIHIYDTDRKEWITTSGSETYPNDADHHSFLVKTGNHFDPIIRPVQWFDRTYVCYRCHVGYDKVHDCPHAKAEEPELKRRKYEPSGKCGRCKFKHEGHYHRCCTNCLADITNCHAYNKHQCYIMRGRVKAFSEEQKDLPHGSDLLRVEPDGRHIYDIPDLRIGDKYIFMDFETMLTRHNHTIKRCINVERLNVEVDRDDHTVNLAVSQYVDGTEFVHRSADEFMEWLIQSDGKTFKHDGYTVIAHYGSGFDFRFCYEWLAKHSTMGCPYTIMDGSKITFMSLKKPNIRFVDSMKFFMTSLTKLPKMMGFSGEMAKGDFPHAFNTLENQSYVGEIPDLKYFGVDEIKEAKTRQERIDWHSSYSGTWDFQAELLRYCQMDVSILRKASMIFRQQFLDSDGLDPFQYTTLPATTMAQYRANHMPRESLAIINEQKDNFSRISLEWLMWRQAQDKQTIQTALSGFEANISVGDRRRPRKVDGLGEDGTVYEFHGCHYHGCPHCFPQRSKKLRESEANDKAIREAGYRLEVMWECEWREMRRADEIRAFLEEIEAILPLCPRDAFYGGRTEAVKLYCNANKIPGGARIFYKDFTSLYPWVMKYSDMPMGHPIIIRDPDKPLKDYFGIGKAHIVPPKGLYHPVLPRKGAKLVFDLSKSWIGTYTTPELMKAEEMGYKIRLLEVHHFDRKGDHIFKSYVDQFLKIKQEASGWPYWVKSDADKDRYIQLYEDREGIRLDKDKIAPNDGLRSFAKLCLNNLWGRFGMRIKSDGQTILKTWDDLLKILSNRSIDHSTLQINWGDGIDIVSCRYQMVEADPRVMFSTNTYIADFTSSYARLKLYGVLHHLGERVLYMDTDSVIYWHENTDDKQHGLQCGDFLGELTDEVGDGHWIEEFVSGGPKNYSYKIAVKSECKPDCDKCGTTHTKIKGFSLSHANRQKLNHETMKAEVLGTYLNEHQRPEGIARDPDNITAESFRIRWNPRTRLMESFIEEKVYSPVVDKRVVQSDRFNGWMLDTLPMGY